MVSSTEIPNAILNTKIVDGLSAISKYPIIAPVINSGIKFGIIEINTILNDLNIQDIKKEIKTITISKLKIKFFNKKFCHF